MQRKIASTQNTAERTCSCARARVDVRGSVSRSRNFPASGARQIDETKADFGNFFVCGRGHGCLLPSAAASIWHRNQCAQKGAPISTSIVWIC
jgi:hypothetical protein